MGIQFLHEETVLGLQEGVTFALDPAAFFVNDAPFDYAVVAVRHTAVDGTPLGDFKYLPLIGITGKIRKGDPVNIISYPNGDKKEYVTTHNRLLDLREDGFMLYEADTAKGSSGSPVFSRYWETVGLHHMGVPRMEDGKLVTKDGRRVPLDAEVQDADLVWVANEGVRVSAIVASLAQKKPAGAEQRRILTELLARTRDPVRLVVEESPLVSGGQDAPSATPSAPGSQDSTSGDPARSQFTFTGPVTIQVAGATAGATGVRITADTETAADLLVSGFAEKALKFDEDYADRTRYGYKAGFLDGWRIPAPTLDKTHHGAPLLTAGKKVWVVPYRHYSLVMNRDRRLLSWAASNVDYSPAARKHTKNRDEYGGDDWRLDPRVALKAPGLQIAGADFYDPATKIDCGHIVRREDGAWGKTAQEAEYGNSDTFHWTNCTPQSFAFNRSNKQGIWGRFEDHIRRQVAANGGRMVVFAGPVLNPDDPTHGYPGKASIQVPMEFWKVVICVGTEGGKRVRLAYGFVFDQTRPIQEKGFERMDMTDYAVYQMPLAEITKKTGVVFHKSVLAADVLKTSGAPESIRGFSAKRITALEEVVLR